MRVPERLRDPRVLDWLPVGVIPPALILDGVLCTHGPHITAWSILSAYAACLPLVLRRRLAFWQLAPLMVGGIIFTLWLLQPGDTVVLIPMTALLQTAADGTRRNTVLTAFITVPCVLVSVLPFSYSDEGSLLVQNVALCLLALAGGEVIRSRRESAERREQAVEQAALRRLGEERLRLARDVHDVVAHAMVAINVQAGVAAHLLESDASQARDALRAIKATSGDALSDLRAALGTLRDPDASAPIAPSGTLDDLEELTAGLRAAGVRVDVDAPRLSMVPGAVHATGYRIAQEALTNVLRHSGARSVDVAVRQDGDDVVLAIRDDGGTDGTDRPVAQPAGAGAGLRGMRERAAALGGTVDAGPAPEGGWRVVASLPAVPA